MKIKPLAICLVIFNLTLYCKGFSQILPCSCIVDTNTLPTGQTQVMFYKQRILVCSDNASFESPGKITVFQVDVEDCLSGNKIIDNNDQGGVFSTVQDYGDSLIITDLVYIPDTSVTMLYDTSTNGGEGDTVFNSMAPLSYRVIKINNNDMLYVSGDIFCFSSFGLIPRQKKLINQLCDTLEGRIMKHDTNFSPFDQTSIDLLFLGAINEDDRAANLFSGLKHNFYINGALAEEVDNLPFEYIMENRKKR